MGPKRAMTGMVAKSLAAVKRPSSPFDASLPSIRRSVCQLNALTACAAVIQPRKPEKAGSAERFNRGR